MYGQTIARAEASHSALEAPVVDQSLPVAASFASLISYYRHPCLVLSDGAICFLQRVSQLFLASHQIRS